MQLNWFSLNKVGISRGGRNERGDIRLRGLRLVFSRGFCKLKSHPSVHPYDNLANSCIDAMHPRPGTHRDGL